MAWKAMDTAPKDGSEVLVFYLADFREPVRAIAEYKNGVWRDHRGTIDPDPWFWDYLPELPPADYVPTVTVANFEESASAAAIKRIHCVGAVTAILTSLNRLVALLGKDNKRLDAAIIETIRKQAEKGLLKYGGFLAPEGVDNERDNVEDALQEAADFVCYGERL